ncbi:MAG: hypothetical protein ACE5LS_02750 [Thermoplasmata archaeon]
MSNDQRKAVLAAILVVLSGFAALTGLLLVVPSFVAAQETFQNQRDPTACAAFGNNWTSCANAFASENAYAYANDSASEGVVAYRSNTGACGGSPLNCAKTRTWDGTVWGSELELSAAGSAVRGTRVVWDPQSDSTEHWIVVYEDDGTLDVYYCSAPGSCSLNLTDAGDLWAAAPGDHSKPYDIAYEATSRDLLLVYEIDVADATRDLAYRTFSRTTLTWSAEQYLDHADVVSTNPVIAWVELAMSVDAGTNNIGLLFFDTTNDDALLTTWKGNGWRAGAHEAVCSTTVTRTDSMGGTIAAEGLSGEYLALCGNGEDSAAYTTWTEASGWSAPTTFDPNSVALNDLRWFASYPRSGSDEIMILYSDDLKDTLASRWSGSALGTWTTLATDSQAGKRRPMGFAWNPDQSATEDGLVVYDINVAGSAAYRTWDNGLASWTTQATFAASGTHRWVEVVGNPNNETLKAKVFLLDDAAFDILSYNWTGSGAPTGQFTISPDTTTRNFEMWESAWGPALPGKNDTAWRNFGFSLNATDTVNTVEIGVEWFRDNVGPILNVTISWDGGTTWAAVQVATNKSTDDNALQFLNFTSAVSWTPSMLSDANLRARAGTNESGGRLDHLVVRVGFTTAAPGCDALTVTTSDPAGQLWFNETIEPDGLPLTTQVNVSASSQDATTPALRVTNDGPGTCDITIRLMSDPGTGRSMKFNTTNNAPWPSDATKEVPLDPSSVTVCTGVGPGGTCDIWLWADFENALGGQTLADVRVENV